MASAYPDAIQATAEPRTLARLQRLSQRVRLNGLGHRRLAETEPRRLLAAVLRDIDETILPRHIQVTTDTRQQISFDVAGRRLLRLEVLGTGGTVGQPDDPVEAAKYLAAELRRSLAHATEVTMQSRRMDTGAANGNVGCSATALAHALGLDLDALDGETLSDKVMRSLHRHARASIAMDGRGQLLRRQGETAEIARLEALSRICMADMTTAFAQSLPRGQKRGCTVFGTDQQSGRQLIFAVCDKTRIVALVDPERIAALLPILQDAFAQ